jgi:hypothetical protein
MIVLIRKSMAKANSTKTKTKKVYGVVNYV